MRFSKSFLNQYYRSDFPRNNGLLSSIHSTFTFVRCALKQTRLVDIFVEPSSNGSDVDVRGVLDGRSVVFQIKSLCSFASDYYQRLNYCTARFYDDILNKFGIFAKVLFTSSPQYPRTIVRHVLERRKVSNSLKVSYGVLYFDVDSLQRPMLARVEGATRRSFVQLRKSGADYKVAVIDIRHEAVNEMIAYNYIHRLFLRKRYEKLAGVILMTFDLSTQKNLVGTKLIPVTNPCAEDPIDWGLIFREKTWLIYGGRQYILHLPTMIDIPSPGWQDWIHMEPSYRLVYKGVEFGRL